MIKITLVLDQTLFQLNRTKLPVNLKGLHSCYSKAKNIFS